MEGLGAIVHKINTSSSNANEPVYFLQKYGSILLVDSKGNMALARIEWDNDESAYDLVTPITQITGSINVARDTSYKHFNATVKAYSTLDAIVLQ